MTKHLLPFRMSLLYNLASSGGGMTGQELLAALAKDYGRERQCNLRSVLDHLFNMTSLGLVSMEGERFDEEHNLVITFAATEDGRSYKKYYPAVWQF